MAFSIWMDFRTWRRSIARLAPVLALAPVLCAQLPAQETPLLPHGQVIPDVRCATNPDQSYALYLPSKYSPDRRWPVIFAFDPGARGRVPVELFRDAAEKYGYIVLGSNNSRNGPFQPSLDAADAMLKDADRRFSLDPRRVYFTGFSGGARVAALVAESCGDCAAGVFAHGGGFPGSRAPSQMPSFVYFAAAGDLDFNYAELVELLPRLDALGVPHRFRVFPGLHQWAPAEVCLEAVEWFERMAMKLGRREKDPAFLAAQFERASRKVRELESAGDLLAVWREVSKLALEFEGLADVSAFSRRAAELKDSPAVREVARRERAAIEEQHRAFAPLAAALNALPADMMERAQIRSDLTAKIIALRKQAERNASSEKGKALRRAQSQLFIHAFEAAQEKLRTRDFPLALALAEIASEISADSSSPFLLLARIHAQNGNKKETLRALEQALAKGSSRETLADFLANNSDFVPYRDLPEFRKLLQPSP